MAKVLKNVPTVMKNAPKVFHKVSQITLFRCPGVVRVAGGPGRQNDYKATPKKNGPLPRFVFEENLTLNPEAFKTELVRNVSKLRDLQ